MSADETLARLIEDDAHRAIVQMDTPALARILANWIADREPVVVDDATVRARTLSDAEALIDLLHEMNEAGIEPSLPFTDSRGISGVAYGVDEGDEMGTAYLSDPGEERYVESESGFEQYIDAWERSVAALHGPIVVLIPAALTPDGQEADR